MRSRSWFVWHTWLGVTGGLLLFVICWSGTVAVFSEEIDWLLNPAERVTPGGAQLEWGRWAEAASRAYPALRVASVHAPRGPRSAAEVWMESGSGQLLRTYVDPYTAEVTGQTTYFNVQRFFRSLHMCLFDVTNTWGGYYLVGAFSLVLLGSAGTALGFYKRWWRRMAPAGLRAWRRAFWSHLHRSGGLWSLWFILVIALTGVWYLAEIAGVELDYPELGPFPVATGAVQPVDALHTAARRAWPGLEVRTLTLPGGYFGPVALFEGQTDALLVRDRANLLVLDARTGHELFRRSAERLAWPARWVDTADPLHFGNFAGIVSKTIWFLFGLLLCLVTLAGTALYGRHLARRATLQRLPAAGVAGPSLLVAGLVLALTSYSAVVDIGGYGPGAADSVEGGPSTPLAVSAFLAAWLLATLGALGWWVRLVSRSPPAPRHLESPPRRLP